MNKEELTDVKGGVSFGIFNVIGGVARFVLSIVTKTVFPIKFRI